MMSEVSRRGCESPSLETLKAVLPPVRAAGSVTLPHDPGTPSHLSLSLLQWFVPSFTEPTREQNRARWLQERPAGQEWGQRCPAPLAAGAAAASSGPCRATGPPLLRPPPPPASLRAPGQPRRAPPASCRAGAARQPGGNRAENEVCGRCLRDVPPLPTGAVPRSCLRRVRYLQPPRPGRPARESRTTAPSHSARPEPRAAV